ncbi:XRE family transcriptional regulator [Agarilytica rhodophyticola]|uniref:XRE family transcriptional regulator n=1 Tax=Agarilytica rhodophyticola TaxID=1737490 RepID=UPI000B348032|nr:XRE family transcriptional regulator [Agarilytica rhodophyticola]
MEKNSEIEFSLEENKSLLSERQISKMSEVHSFSGVQLDNLKVLHQESSNEETLKIFRQLRTQLYDRMAGNNYVCMVTSVCSGGGASYTANNLAAAIALDKSKTSVVVDCNFYNPSVDALLSADANLGLIDFLSSQEMGVEFILYASGIKRLRVVPAGKHINDATEKMCSSKMVAFISEIKSRYSDRYIIVDSPSVGEFAADARILTQLCDFVVLVVPYGKVSQQQVQEAIDTIGEQRIVGVVYNNV